MIAQANDRQDGTLSVSRNRAGVPLQRGGARPDPERFLAAAETVFAHLGYAEATIDKVVRRAQVGRATIYRAFRSKAELYVAVLSRANQPFEEAIAQVPQGLSPPDEIRWLARRCFEHRQRSPRAFQVFEAIARSDVLADLSPETVERVSRQRERVIEQLTASVSRGIAEGSFAPIPPQESAELLWRLCRGLTGRRDERPSGREVSAATAPMLEQAVEILIRGLAAQTEETRT